MNFKIIFSTITTLIWSTFWLILAIGIFNDTPKQIKKDKLFIESELEPVVIFIENFQKQKKRLPSSQEFFNFSPNKNAIYIRNQKEISHLNKEEINNIDWNRNFAIEVWRGEWNEYYYSWNKKYDTNNYTWIDGLLGLIITSLIAFLPFIFWIIFIINKRRLL